MKIGVPKEIKPQEFRVGLTPESASALIAQGHEVSIETNAGMGIGVTDADYEAVGAKIAASAADIFDQNEMIIKVKEPQPPEIAMLKPSHLLYTYLHLAPDPEQTKGLVDSGCVAIAYETITDNKGALPLLKPMSEVAGRLSIQAGANFLQKANGGRGILLGGVPGVKPANVVVLGGGIAGTHAAEMAVGLRANVSVFDINVNRLAELDREFRGSIQTVYSTQAALEAALAEADLVIGAVLVQGAKAPHLVKASDLKNMKDGAVMVDIAIDQGGCFETSKATTHAEPVYTIDGVVHYCVANMPGAVPYTSTYALNAATLPHAIALANKGWEKATADNEHLANGLNVIKGKVVHPAVLDALPEFA
jgi:alanine dehydrogenase